MDEWTLAAVNALMLTNSSADWLCNIYQRLVQKKLPLTQIYYNLTELFLMMHSTGSIPLNSYSQMNNPEPKGPHVWILLMRKSLFSLDMLHITREWL